MKWLCKTGRGFFGTLGISFSAMRQSKWFLIPFIIGNGDTRESEQVWAQSKWYSQGQVLCCSLWAPYKLLVFTYKLVHALGHCI